MNTISTKNLQVGNVISIDGKPREITSKEKAWKAPEYLITFMMNGQKVTRSIHSNKKFALVS